MAKPKKVVAVTNKTFANVYHYERETKGTWVYTLKLAEGERKSGSNALYLLKTEYQTKPGDIINATFVIG